MRRISKEDYLSFFFLLAIVFWFNHEMMWTDQVPFFRDLGPYFYPMRFSLAKSLKAGELPLWDRHVGMGFPLLADFQSGTFYLPHLFFLIFPFFTAIRVLFVFHYLVAAAGSYLLCRHWKYPPYLAIIGATLFTFGGVIVSLSNLLNHFQAAVWLPGVILLWEKTLLSRYRRHFLALTLALLLQFLAGSPEIYAMGLGLLLLDGLRINGAEGIMSFLKPFFLLGAANVLVAGLAMIQLLPTIELFFESRGFSPILYPESSLWSFHPWSLINLFFLDKEVDAELFSGLHLFFVREVPFFVSHYMGAISLIGICCWFFYASRKEKSLLIGLIMISIVVAMGSHTPIYTFLFRYVPFLGLFRFPEKFFFLTYSFLLFISLRGLYDLLKQTRPSRIPFLILCALSVCLIMLYLFFRLDIESLFRVVTWAKESSAEEALRSSSGILLYLERQIALIAGILLLLYLWKRGKLKTAVFHPLIVGLVFFDLTSSHQPYRFLLEPSFVWKNPKIVTISDSEPYRLFYYPSSSNIHPSYYPVVSPKRFAEFNELIFENLLPNTGIFYSIDYMQEMDALMRWPYRFLLGVAEKIPIDRLTRLMSVSNVKYVNSLEPMPDGDITLVHHFSEYPSWLYRLNRTVPRVFIVPKAIQENDSLQIMNRLISEKFDPLKEVVLDRLLAIPPKEDFRGQAEIRSYANQKVTIRASLNGPGILVLADSYYPGWRVFVNGNEGEILRANLFFRAVALSAGDHIVEFRYQPWSFTMGLIISLVTLCGVMIGTLVRSYRKRKEAIEQNAAYSSPFDGSS